MGKILLLLIIANIIAIWFGFLIFVKVLLTSVFIFLGLLGYVVWNLKD